MIYLKSVFHFRGCVFAIYRQMTDLGQGERNSELWFKAWCGEGFPD